MEELYWLKKLKIVEMFLKLSKKFNPINSNLLLLKLSVFEFHCNSYNVILSSLKGENIVKRYTDTCLYDSVYYLICL